MNMGRTVSYESIRHSAPVSLMNGGAPSGRRRKRQLTVRESLLYFGIVFIIMLLIGSRLYIWTGSMPAASFIQQFFFLASAIAAVSILRADFREVFPFRRPRAMAVGGIFVLLLAMYLAADVFSLVSLYFWPDTVTGTSEKVTDLLLSLPLPVELLLAGFCPAICEEAMHRGVMFSGIRNSMRRHKWAACLLSGLLFGVFHMYPIRMVMPALLGVIMAFLVWETGNMFYSCLLHFGYNTLLMLASRAASSMYPDAAEDAQQVLSGTVTGTSVIVLGILIPFLIYLGVWMVRRVTAVSVPDLVPEGKQRRTLLQIGLPTLGIILLGIIVLLR